MTSQPPRPPSGLKARGHALWLEVTGAYDLDAHELGLLTEACRCLDILDRLEVQTRTAELVVTGPKGGSKANPLLAEARAQRLVLARLIATLRLPSGETGERPQRRGAVRGTYAPRYTGPGSAHRNRRLGTAG